MRSRALRNSVCRALLVAPRARRHHRLRLSSIARIVVDSRFCCAWDHVISLGLSRPGDHADRRARVREFHQDRRTATALSTLQQPGLLTGEFPPRGRPPSGRNTGDPTRSIAGPGTVRRAGPTRPFRPGSCDGTCGSIFSPDGRLRRFYLRDSRVCCVMTSGARCRAERAGESASCVKILKLAKRAEQG